MTLCTGDHTASAVVSAVKHAVVNDRGNADHDVWYMHARSMLEQLNNNQDSEKNTSMTVPARKGCNGSSNVAHAEQSRSG